jgi:diguanylate cyclase (GGDEF)-like protein
MSSKKKNAEISPAGYKASAARHSARQALIYVALGCLWIFISDRLMDSISADHDSIVLISTVKGVVYVLVTAAIFFLLMYSAMKKILKSNRDIRRLAYFDEVTGLFNRQYVEQALRELDSDKSLPLSVIIGDFNGLKLVNDAFGHPFGNELLKLSADVIKRVCRETDIVSRWGGDEFLILLPRTDRITAARLVGTLKDECAKCHLRSITLDMTFGWCTEDSSSGKAYTVINEAENMMYERKIVDSKSMRSHTIKAIMSTLHEKNPREAAHSNRVGEICRLLCEAAGLGSLDSAMMSTIGFLHDIGKIAIGDDILNKEQKLTSDELQAIRQHPEIGYRILLSAYGVSDITKGILSHHERWDGQGYPKGLKGTEIPLISRIITIADSYDAMTSVRPYKNRMTPEEAAEELKKHAGTQFDPDLAGIFIEKVVPLSTAPEAYQ